MKQETRKPVYWYACCVAMLILTIFAYSPIVIPYGIYKPTLWGLPYTLWLSILLTFSMVVLTYVATLTHPGEEE